MEHFDNFLIIYMFILDRGEVPEACSSYIYNNTCKYNVYLCMNYQIYVHTIQ